MLNNDLLADVYFIVGSGSTKRRIPAHKYILVTGSSVFHAMFCGGLPEEKEVAIPDVEPQAFLNLLKWVYDLRINRFESNMELTVTRFYGVVSCRFVGKKTQLIFNLRIDIETVRSELQQLRHGVHNLFLSWLPIFIQFPSAARYLTDSQYDH